MTDNEESFDFLRALLGERPEPEAPDPETDDLTALTRALFGTNKETR